MMGCLVLRRGLSREMESGVVLLIEEEWLSWGARPAMWASAAVAADRSARSGAVWRT